MDLHILEHRVRVLSVARCGLWLYTHPLLKLLFLPQRCRCKFFSLTETPEDYTIMLDEEGFKELPPSEFMQVADSTWLALSVVSNGRASSGCQATGVTKIAKSVIAPLAEHNVSVLMLSTYQTDFILVREKDLPAVIHTLAGEFDIYKEENGEFVPVNRDDVSNGFLKPKPAASPTVHPVQSPQNRFCILTVAPDTLPAIATMLIDVLFYSPSPPKEALPGRQELDTITFFAFSLIEGYISIVMDAETQKRFPSDLLLTSSTGELWRMVRIGGQPLGFGGFCPRVPAAGPRPALTAGPSPPQTSAASWPRSPSPWPLRTYRRTTSAPSTSITPWSPRRASPRSSSCSSGARRAAADSRRARRRRHPDAPAHGYPSSGSGAPSSPTVALAAAKLGLSCCSGWPARGRARGTAVLFGRRGSRESSTAPPRRQARGWRAAAARPQPRALLGLSLLAASDAFFYKK
ncbi:cytosolic arginine sensor for mTORC1 subunit 1 isoform X2 [Dromaius novaehollandiae]|uniref:cytosolic arginine sensor for mTORC1 subunit 1 isoform X2 n=1 Tax=Dromaius novaehollandiae TaxID=8790 RepID=UPI00311F9E29